MKASIVIGLGYGDEGKGITTDSLCLQEPDNSIVIRFSGGQQAGHTVIKDGIKHIHSNYGSGTLRGVPSYFSEHCTIYLNTMDEEKHVLKRKGIIPKLFIHPLAKLTTPYDVAYNRLTERENNHGSCGLGVGATMKRHETTPYKLYAVDLTYPDLLLQKLDKIKHYYYSLFDEVTKKRFIGEYLQYEHIFHELIFKYDKMFEIQNYSYLRDNYSNLIFEGSQGIMLDMDHGLFPNVTYANTTSKNAIEICDKLRIPIINLYYITRCYQTRHGAGWMSNTDKIELINNHEEINTFNEWQKHFKVSELDYNMLNYALNVDNIYSSCGVTKHLVITCCDQRPDWKFEHSKIENYITSTTQIFSPVTQNLGF